MNTKTISKLSFSALITMAISILFLIAFICGEANNSFIGYYLADNVFLSILFSSIPVAYIILSGGAFILGIVALCKSKSKKSKMISAMVVVLEIPFIVLAILSLYAYFGFSHTMPK
jgi:hypothetical protein